MVAVYAEIYQPCYHFESVAMAPARRTVAQDVVSLGLDPVTLSRSSVFNVGTGREAVAFVDLGAARVFHADLSETPTAELAALARRDSRYAAISSRRLDLCRDRISHVTAPIDLAYLN